MPLTAGIDVGTGAVKVADLRRGRARRHGLRKGVERFGSAIRLRSPRSSTTSLLAANGLNVRISPIARRQATAKRSLPHRPLLFDDDSCARRSLPRPDARAVLDVGALHGRAIRTDERGKVIGYKMTSQCASGSGQFLENIARYLGIAHDEIGSLSRQADDPEKVSSICAVLAETDVINMVSRGITAPNILKGIHDSWPIGSPSC